MAWRWAGHSAPGQRYGIVAIYGSSRDHGGARRVGRVVEASKTGGRLGGCCGVVDASGPKDRQRSAVSMTSAPRTPLGLFDVTATK
jgi:hypothetical protein